MALALCISHYEIWKHLFQRWFKHVDLTCDISQNSTFCLSRRKNIASAGCVYYPFALFYTPNVLQSVFKAEMKNEQLRLFSHHTEEYSVRKAKCITEHFSLLAFSHWGAKASLRGAITFHSHDNGRWCFLKAATYFLLTVEQAKNDFVHVLLFFWSSGKKGWWHSTTLFLSINFMKLLLSQCLSTTIHTTCIRGMKVLPHKCNIYLCLTSVCSGLCMKTQQQTYGMCFLQVQVFIIGIQRFNAECQRPQLLHPKKTKLKTTGGGKTLNWNW